VTAQAALYETSTPVDADVNRRTMRFAAGDGAIPAHKTCNSARNRRIRAHSTLALSFMAS